MLTSCSGPSEVTHPGSHTEAVKFVFSLSDGQVSTQEDAFCRSSFPFSDSLLDCGFKTCFLVASMLLSVPVPPLDVRLHLALLPRGHPSKIGSQ